MQIPEKATQQNFGKSEVAIDDFGSRTWKALNTSGIWQFLCGHDQSRNKQQYVTITDFTSKASNCSWDRLNYELGH